MKDSVKRTKRQATNWDENIWETQLKEDFCAQHAKKPKLHRVAPAGLAQLAGHRHAWGWGLSHFNGSFPLFLPSSPLSRINKRKKKNFTGQTTQLKMGIDLNRHLTK